MEKTVKKFGRPNLIIALVVLIAVVIGGWYEYHHTHSTTNGANGSLAVKLDTYKDTADKFQFTYPDSWGKPLVAQDKGVSGSHYSVVFDIPEIANKGSLNITLAMDTNNYQRKICPGGQCSIISNPVTSKNIQSDLKNHTSAFIRHDNSSYGFITSVAGSRTTLLEEQVVSLPAINVSAAVATYTISSVSDCPLNKFASPSQSLCINGNDYNTVSNFLKSIKAV